VCARLPGFAAKMWVITRLATRLPSIFVVDRIELTKLDSESNSRPIAHA
jgi:hypothetical protein